MRQKTKQIDAIPLLKKANKSLQPPPLIENATKTCEILVNKLTNHCNPPSTNHNNSLQPNKWIQLHSAKQPIAKSVQSARKYIRTIVKSVKTDLGL
jgi:hypothetical protein